MTSSAIAPDMATARSARPHFRTDGIAPKSDFRNKAHNPPVDSANRKISAAIFFEDERLDYFQPVTCNRRRDSRHLQCDRCARAQLSLWRSGRIERRHFFYRPRRDLRLSRTQRRRQDHLVQAVIDARADPIWKRAAVRQ